ncbi:MAG TPA: hypothetical protein PLM79_14915 [Syntrophobacteraceae bacterium]|nr:hypothetical protein [Syntrophobacteraceae bacterium]
MSEAPKGQTPTSLEGVRVVSPKEARKIQGEGGLLIACYTHMTDWVQARPVGSVHITMDVPKDHKRTDFDLKDAEFDLSALPADKDRPIVLFCADDM